jgi:hypothetical protein
MAVADSRVSRGSDLGHNPAADEPGRSQPVPRRRMTGLSPRPAAAAAPPPAAAAEDPEQVFSRRQRWVALAAAPFTASMLLHVIVSLVMALAFTINVTQEEPPLRITASVTDDEVIDDFAEMEPLEIKPVEDHEIEEPAIDAAVDPGEVSIGDVAVAGAVVADAGDLGAIGPVGDIGDLAGLEMGTGLGGEGDGAGAAAGATFFGAKSTGQSFVFVVDNSFSMKGGRFETALTELARAVSALGPKQQFYVLFFSDTSYGLFHPETEPGFVPATDANKQRLMAWLSTVEMCLRTNGEEAMQKALSLNPDVINMLGDGAFGDKTVPLVTAPHSRRTVINTFGMGLDSKTAAGFMAIAEANGGTYRGVDVSPEAKQAAKTNPIKRNITRGAVWGLKLPAQAK